MEPDWNNKTVKELKEELKKKGLKQTGNKQDLIDRLEGGSNTKALLTEIENYLHVNKGTTNATVFINSVDKIFKTYNEMGKMTNDNKSTRKLLVCHGANYKPVKGWEDADTTDISEDTKPTFIADISSHVPKKYKNMYDEIMMVYCPIVAYLNVPDIQLVINRRKQKITANRKTFENLYFLLKPDGKLYINNISLYLRNAKLGRKTLDQKLQTFIQPISDLFSVVELRDDTLILKK